MVDIVAEFAPAKESVSWAEDAVSDLKRDIDAFFKGDVAEVITNFDAKTRENVQKVRLKEPLSRRIARRATEALTTTRHAFDQATFAARNLTSGKSAKSIYYPWARKPGDLDHLLQARGIDQRLWDTFRSHEPYPRADGYTGGDDVIRALATIANKKHTVGLSVAGHVASTRFPDIHGNAVESMKIMSPWWDPVKNEAELIRWIGDLDVHGNYEFRFEVLFKDAGLSQPVNAVAGLTAFAAKAKAVVESLERRCIEIHE